MFAEERKFEIMDYLKRKKNATVGELADKFDVSHTTIRTDLNELEKHGMILRTHGGAIIKTKTGFELELQEKKVQNIEAKKIIAKKAIDLIDDGDTIAIDTGSTTQEFARLLGEKKNLTVVTNDLIIALMCESYQSVHCILLGGAIRQHFHCTVDDAGREMIVKFSVDKAIMGTTGFTFQKGATTPDLNQARLKRSMIDIAHTVIFLADSTKFGHNSFAQFASTDLIDILVTDQIDSCVAHELEFAEFQVVT